MDNSGYSFRRVLCSLSVILVCGFRSLPPRGDLRSYAPEGSVRLGQALPPCGVESEPYAMPEARAAGRKPGALCGRFLLVFFSRSSGCGVVPGVICCVECIVVLSDVWTDHGVVP